MITIHPGDYRLTMINGKLYRTNNKSLPKIIKLKRFKGAIKTNTYFGKFLAVDLWSLPRI